MTKLWMCRNCLGEPNENGVAVPGRKFEADLPVCPHCGADRRNPRHATYIAECEVIHFDPPDAVLHDRGRNTAACDPTVVIGSLRDGEGVRPHYGTAHRSAVTCPKCKQSAEFAAGVEAGRTLKARD